MSLYGALYSGVAGLNSQSNKIGIISDNISNVNTVGYKGASGQFETLVTNSGIVSAYSPGGVIGGNRQLVDKQGLITGTDSSTDIAISGSGFFAVNTQAGGTGETLFTRAGSFRQDSNGDFRNTGGYYLLAWPLDRDSRLPGEPGNTLYTSSSANTSSLQVVNVKNVTGQAAATTKVALGANLKASETIYPGAAGTVKMDINNVRNYGITSDTIFVPGGANSLTRGDKFSVSTGSGLNYDYRYEGFTFGRDIQTAANGDSGGGLLPNNVSLAANPFAVANNSNVVTVTQANHGLTNGAVITLSNVTSAVGDIPASDFNRQFVVTVTGPNTYTINTPTPNTAGTVTAGGGTGATATIRPFSGFIFDATSSNQTFLGTTGISGFTTAALSFTLNSSALTGPQTFTYTSSSPNSALGQFNNLDTLAKAINDVTGISSRVYNGRLYVAPDDANASLSFANGSTAGSSGPPVQAGLDWVRELGLANFSAGSNRFNSMKSLATNINASPGLNASITDPDSQQARLKINVKDPLDTITFSDWPVDTNLINFTSATPFTTTTGSNLVTIGTPSPHGFTTGDIVTLDPSAMTVPGSETYNGIPISDFNNRFVITVTGPSTFTIRTATAATASGVDSTPSSGTFAGLVVTPHNNTGSILGELGLAPSLLGGPYVAATPASVGPAYDPTNGTKNMASGTIVAQFSRPVRVFDSQGTGHDVQVSYIKTAQNNWAVEIHVVPASDISSTLPNGLVAYGNVVFNGDGSLRTVSAGLTQPVSMNWVNGAAPSVIGFNLGTSGEPFGTPGAASVGGTDGLTQFNASSSVNFITQNGAPVGELSSVNITDEGFVVATYSNGQTQKLYRIPLASFTNPNQMEVRNGNVFGTSASSGEVNLRVAGTNGTGKIAASSLETSNVELSQQLTDLIVAQRAYQANTKIITTTDQLLEELNQAIR